MSSSRSNRSRIPDIKKRRELRKDLFENQKGCCFYCNKPMVLPEAGSTKQTEDTATFDHIVAASKGGPARADNFVLACMGCNQERRNNDFFVFVTKMNQKHGVI